MATDSDGLANAPWYVQFAVRVGVPTMFASVLLWFMLTNVTGALNQVLSNQTLLQQTNATVIANQSRILELLAQSEDNNLRTRAILAALCYNAADTPAARDRCTMSQ